MSKSTTSKSTTSKSVVLIACLVLCSCNTPQTSPEKTKAPLPAPQTAQATAPTTATTPTTTPTNTPKVASKDTVKTADPNEPKDLAKIGSDLMANESVGPLKLGLTMQKVLQILGEPEYKSKATLWGADGEYHQRWQYGKQDIELDIMGAKSTDKTLNGISVGAPSTFKTPRGIGIGSSIEEVKAAYKNDIDPQSSNGETIIAGSIYGGIMFGITNGKVASIYIGASAE
jgi:hypothetical protein